MSQKRSFGFHDMTGPPKKRHKMIVDEVSTLFHYLMELRKELIIQFVHETGLFDNVEFQGGLTVKLEENEFPSIPPRLFKVNQAFHLISSILSIGNQETGVLTNQFGFTLRFYRLYPLVEFHVPSSSERSTMVLQSNGFQDYHQALATVNTTFEFFQSAQAITCTPHEVLTKVLLSFHHIEPTREMMSISNGNLSSIIMNFIESVIVPLEPLTQVQDNIRDTKEFEPESKDNPRQAYVRDVLKGMLKRTQALQYKMLKSFVHTSQFFHQVVFSGGIVITMNNMYIPCIPQELLDTVLELSWLRSVYTLISSTRNAPVILTNSFGLKVNFQKNEYTFQLERPKQALFANTIEIPDNFCGSTLLRNRECFSRLLSDHIQFSIAPTDREDSYWILYNGGKISEFVKTLFTFHGLYVNQARANLFSRVLELFCPFPT